MLTKKIPLSLILSGLLMYFIFDDPNMHITFLHWAGLYIGLLGFLLIPFYHIVRADKKGKLKLQKPKSFLFYAGLGTLALAVIGYYLTSNEILVCSGEGFDCFGPWFFFIIPCTVLSAGLLIASMFKNKVR
jgi:hypothetical protein